MTIFNKFPKNKIYHIFNKSISNFAIFKYEANVQRFINTLDFYNNKTIVKSFSGYLKINKNYQFNSLLFSKQEGLVKFIAYCIMPDHYHLLVKILAKNRLSKYMSDVENSYTRFFNLKVKRKGPLWQTGFKSVLIRSSEQLLHVSRYIHLNPTTSLLVKKPEDWQFSSYKDYIYNPKILFETINEISIKNPILYKKFVENNISYQKTLKTIKNKLLE